MTGTLEPPLRPVRHLVVVGATGDVGRGIVAQALSRSWRVTAVARTESHLDALVSQHSSAALTALAGSVEDEEAAAALAGAPAYGEPDALVVSVNSWAAERAMTEWTAAELRGYLDDNLLPHLVAARVLLPKLPSGGRYVAIGGGMADAVLPGLGHLSLTQAALRMVIRSVHHENDRPVHVREVLVSARVSGHSRRNTRGTGLINADELGRHICDVVQFPERHREPVVAIVP